MHGGQSTPGAWILFRERGLRRRRLKKPTSRGRVATIGAIAASFANCETVIDVEPIAFTPEFTELRAAGEKHQPPSDPSSVSDLSGSAFEAACEPVRSALGGMGSLRSQCPENESAREPRWLGDAGHSHGFAPSHDDWAAPGAET